MSRELEKAALQSIVKDAMKYHVEARKGKKAAEPKKVEADDDQDDDEVEE